MSTRHSHLPNSDDLLTEGRRLEALSKTEVVVPTHLEEAELQLARQVLAAAIAIVMPHGSGALAL